jgi:hypothetical protein
MTKSYGECVDFGFSQAALGSIYASPKLMRLHHSITITHSNAFTYRSGEHLEAASESVDDRAWTDIALTIRLMV